MAESYQSCGFCIFNNVAIGALHALATWPQVIRRVAIIDIDIHHGAPRARSLACLRAFGSSLLRRARFAAALGGAAWR